ncbi:MAG: hypothetical protein ACREVR_12665 [Burkholderiales bacterium]
MKTFVLALCPVFHEVRAPTATQLHDLLAKLITRIMKCLTRRGYLVAEEAMTYLADTDPDNVLAPLQAASCTFRSWAGPSGWGRFAVTSVPLRASRSLCRLVRQP